MSAESELDEQELQRIYTWVDEIPLSRPKRNIARDFADGVLVAEIVHHYFPKLVELHNYSPANGMTQKLYNWTTLNQKVLRKLGWSIPKQDIDQIVGCQAGAIERILKQLQIRLAKYRTRKADDVSFDGVEARYRGDGASVGTAASRQHEYDVAAAIQRDVDNELLVEKEQTILELRETVEILEVKVRKLEQLLKIKDAKIDQLAQKLQRAGLS